MIINQDATGPVPEPDATGEITLTVSNSTIWGYYAICAGLLLFGAAMWRSYILNPLPALLIACMIMSPLFAFLVFCFIGAAIRPLRLVINDTGVTKSISWRPKKIVTWEEMSGIKLTSVVRARRGQSRDRNRYVSTIVTVIGQKAKIQFVSSLGVAPSKLVAYLQERHKASFPSQPLTVDDQTLPADTSIAAHKKTSQQSRLLFLL